MRLGLTRKKMPKEKPKQTTLDEKFIVNLHGKDFCIYEGVLNLAHKKKLKRLEVKLLQVIGK